ncbi:MAG: PAS domain-containing sensor histidine kinase, partial [bacterium]
MWVPLKKPIFTIPTKQLLFVILYAVTSFQAANGQDAVDWESLPYVFEIESRFVAREETYRGTARGLSITVVDIDQDDEDEFLLPYRWSDNKHTLTCYDGGMESVKWIYTQSPYIFPPLCADLDFNGQKDVILSSKEGDKIYLGVLDSLRSSVRSFIAIEGVDNDSSGNWDGYLYPEIAVDLSGDGYKDVIAIVGSGYDRRPRGVYAFDLKNQKSLWKYDTGPALNEILLADVTGDGVRDIICSTAAVANSNTANEGESNATDDKLSYIIVIGRDGAYMWQTITGGEFSGCHITVGDVNGDSIYEIISSTYNENAEFTGTNKISIWSWDGEGALNIRAQDSSYSSFASPVLSNNVDDDSSSSEIVVGTLDGQVRVYGSDLALISKRRFETGITNSSIYDLDNDGKEEIVVSMRDGKTLALSLDEKSELKALARFDDTGTFRLMRVGSGRPPKLLLLSQDFLYLLHFKKRLLPPFPTTFFVAGILVGTALLFIGFVIIERVRRRKPYFKFKDRFFDGISSGVVSINSKGKITLCNPRAEEILNLHGKNIIGEDCREILKSHNLDDILELVEDSQTETAKAKPQEVWLKVGDESKDVLISIMPLVDGKNRDGGRVITLEDITEVVKSKSDVAWLSTVRRLTHDFKTPLSKIKTNTQRLQMEYQSDGVAKADAYDRYSNFIVEQSDRLSEMCKGLMRFIGLERPNFVQANINKLIEKIMESYKQGIPDNIHLKTVLADDLPAILVDESHFKSMMSNLIDNAIHAMPDGGTLTVSTFRGAESGSGGGKGDKKFISIEVSDTGVGISEQDLKKVFDPYFTKSKGSGMGLMIVKQIVSEHQGTIDIKSRKGFGTTVSVHLPVKMKLK